METLFFTPTVGPKKKRILFEAPKSLQFFEVINQMQKEHGFEGRINISTPQEITLTPTQLHQTVAEIVKQFGNSFTIIESGEAGFGRCKKQNI
ncbi:MAG: hypothetical protein ACFFCD_18130 [Promethearchaeota archaeon]